MITKNTVTHFDHYIELCISKYADDLINDALDFFHYRNYSTDIVDIVQTTAKSLHMNILIHQQSTEGKIQVIKQSGGAGCKNVYLQYQNNILHQFCNHYNAITLRPLLENNVEQSAGSSHRDIESSTCPPSPPTDPSTPINIYKRSTQPAPYVLIDPSTFSAYASI